MNWHQKIAERPLDFSEIFTKGQSQEGALKARYETSQIITF